MPEEQILAWIEYDYEIGLDYNDNLRSGVIASAIYNVNRSKKSDKVLTPYDIPFLKLKKPGKNKPDKQSRLMSKDDYKSFKELMKACGKPIKTKKKE